MIDTLPNGVRKKPSLQTRCSAAYVLAMLLTSAVQGTDAGPMGTREVAVAGAKPNIIFILTDDQGYGDLGCYGSTTIETPHIDALREQGMKFTSFYVHNRLSLIHI